MDAVEIAISKSVGPHSTPALSYEPGRRRFESCSVMMPSHEPFMRLALEQARRALDAGEVPVGAVVALDGEAIGHGFNCPISTHDPTAHAEIAALRAAAQHLGNYRLSGATLYVTVEPCLMCVGAMVHARIGTLVYGAPERKAGAVCSTMRALEHPGLNHRVAVVPGVLEHECREVIQAFFRSRRGPESGG